jgi:uncharacterized membrane protein required for colicin V production
MTGADIAIAIGIGGFILSGLYEGFIRKIFGLIVLIVAFYTAINTHQAISEWLQVQFEWSLTVSTILSFLAVFLVILISGNVLYRVFGSKNGLYRSWDRLAGAGFGLIEGAIIVSLILHLLSLIEVPSAEMIDRSVIYPLVYAFAPFVFEVLYLFIPQVREFFDLFIRNVDLQETFT